MKETLVMLPSIERSKKLPVVLGHKEVKQLLRTPKLLKHRLVHAMLYGCGLRYFKLLNVQRKDLDFDRRMLHIRQGKGRKDRYVQLSDLLIRGLKNYLLEGNPALDVFQAMKIQANQSNSLPEECNILFGKRKNIVESKRKLLLIF